MCTLDSSFKGVVSCLATKVTVGTNVNVLFACTSVGNILRSKVGDGLQGIETWLFFSDAVFAVQ